MPMAKKNAERAAECFVIRVALLSRLVLLALIAFWRLLFSPYDTSASLNPSCLGATARGQQPEAVLWPRVGAAIEASVVWDGVFFLRIAQCGYEYEQAYAFLPLLPACIVLLTRSGELNWIPFFFLLTVDLDFGTKEIALSCCPMACLFFFFCPFSVCSICSFGTNHWVQSCVGDIRLCVEQSSLFASCSFLL